MTEGLVVFVVFMAVYLVLTVIQKAVFNFKCTHDPGKAIDGPAIAGFEAGER